MYVWIFKPTFKNNWKTYMDMWKGKKTFTGEKLRKTKIEIEIEMSQTSLLEDN